jgi:hypothetical protein
LFLLTFLQINGTKADQYFKNCLSDLSSTEGNPYVYELLLNFPPFKNETNITRDDWLEVCCDTTQCYSVPMGLKCKDNSPFKSFQCSRFGSGIFCRDKKSVCCGMVGDRLIANNATKGNCAENGITIDLITKHISDLSFDNFDDLKNKSYIRLDFYRKKIDASCNYSSS